MTKAFSMFLWQNSPSVNTPLGESKLNLINTALNEVDNRVLNLDTTKANQTDLLTAVADVTYNESTGIFTVTKKNGSKTTIDTKLEKLAINFTYDSINQQLVIHLSDGTYQYVDLKALITELEFLNSDTVLFSVTNGKVTANIAKGSITADMLEPNYLANVELYASQALQSAESAEESARKAEESALRAKEEADRATSIVGGDFATNTKVDNIINGTTTVGNASKLNGKAESELEVANADTVNGFTVYNSLTELGLDEATATAESIVNAMANNSMLLHRLGGSATNATLQFPYNYSTFKVTKLSSSYVLFECVGTGNLPIYYAYYNGGSTNKWSGWSTQYLPLTGGTLSGNVNVDRGTNAGILASTRTLSDGSKSRSQFWNGPGYDAHVGVYNATSNAELASLSISVEKMTYKNSGGSKDVLHTGNSAKVTIDTNAPTDGLWVVP